MRLSTLLIALGALALITTAPACGSDDTNTDTNTTADTTDDPAGDATEEPAGDATEEPAGDATEEPAGDVEETPEDDAGTTEGGACTNADDMAVIGDESVDVTAVATTAAYACLTDPDIGACVAAAVEAETSISNDCALCYAEQVVCAATNCMAVCLADSEAQECVDCRNEYCAPLFEPCSGIAASASDDE